MTSVDFLIELYKVVNNVRSRQISKDVRLNESIRAPQLRVITEDGQQYGVLSRQDALRAAREQGLDLVEVSPQANPPVAKIIDWGKYNYQRTKQQQKSKRNAKAVDMKQMRLGLKIGDHDLEVKLNKVRKFLEAGHKVKFTIFFRGRELAHKEIGHQIAEKIIERLGDSILVDQNPQFSGRQIIFVVRSNTNAKAKNS